jgi:hypothetical protein
MKRLTDRILDALNSVASHTETILEHGGEGWALECVAGPDGEPCGKLKTCETCRNFKDCEDAAAWLRGFVWRQQQRRARRKEKAS